MNGNTVDVVTIDGVKNSKITPSHSPATNTFADELSLLDFSHGRIHLQKFLGRIGGDASPVGAVDRFAIVTVLCVSGIERFVHKTWKSKC